MCVNDYLWLIPLALSIISLGMSFSGRKATNTCRLMAMPEFRSGWVSHSMGLGVTENPHDTGTNSFKAWKLGWEYREYGEASCNQ